jgi:stage IV sporulation protein FA
MKNRADEIRKRHQERKKQVPHREKGQTVYLPEFGEREDYFPYYKNGGHEENAKPHPLFKKERVLIRIMAAVCLFLVIGILFKHPNPNLSEARAYVNNVFQEEFQFAVVSQWYEDQFGKPLALFPPTGEDTPKQNENGEPNYAVPVAGTVLQTFEDNGKGIMLETVGNTAVEAVEQGYVHFIGKKDDLEKTVIIQHPDGNESWYGQLESIDVNMYDYVKKGAKLGTVTAAENGKSGTFYFALNQGGDFVNPLKVISFD